MQGPASVSLRSAEPEKTKTQADRDSHKFLSQLEQLGMDFVPIILKFTPSGGMGEQSQWQFHWQRQYWIRNCQWNPGARPA